MERSPREAGSGSNALSPVNWRQPWAMLSVLVTAVALATALLPALDGEMVTAAQWSQQLSRGVAGAVISVAVLLLSYGTLSRRAGGSSSDVRTLIELAGVAGFALAARALLDRMVPAGMSTGGEMRLSMLIGLRLADVAVLGILAQGAVHWRRSRLSRHNRARLLDAEQDQRLNSRKAELRVRKAELLPHFMCNALSAVAYGLATSPSTAADLLRAIERILADARSRLLLDFTTVSDEVSRLEPFIEIERARLGRALAVRVAVDPSLNDAPIPDWILQPLMENAVRHGLLSTGGGSVDITVRPAPSPEHYLVEVVDSADVSSSAPQAADSFPVASSSIGLANIRSRLSALYGGDAQLTLSRSAQGLGVSANLVLPRYPMRETNAKHVPTKLATRTRAAMGMRRFGWLVAASLIVSALAWTGNRLLVTIGSCTLVVLAAVVAGGRPGVMSARAPVIITHVATIGALASIVASAGLVFVESEFRGVLRAIGAVIAFGSLYVATIGMLFVAFTRRSADRLLARLRRAGRRIVGEEQRGTASVQQLTAHSASIDALQPALAVLAERAVRDPVGAANIINELAGLLRSELRRAPSVVTLADEITELDAVVAFARSVVGPTLTVEWEVEPALRSAQVPTRLLRSVLPLLLHAAADIGREGQWSIRGRCRGREGQLKLQLHLPTRLLASGMADPIARFVAALKVRMATMIAEGEPTVRVLSAADGCDVVAFDLPLVLEGDVLLEDAAGG
jgi:hypothetical protein